MYRKIKALLRVMMLSTIIIIGNIIYMYPLIHNKKATLIHRDFNSIRNNFIQEEKMLIQKDNSWSLTIPSINLENVEIKESVDSETLENYIGHFTFSSYFDGNVCLAAHNNGFKDNYFSNICLLQNGQSIFYSYLNNSREYIVTDSFIISDTDFSVLKDIGKNEITLITCVPDSPSLRLCVKAVSKE